jgi:hypothetical protein
MQNECGLVSGGAALSEILQVQVMGSGRQRAQHGAAGLSLDTKEKALASQGAGLEFDTGETLEVSCLTHDPNPPNPVFGSGADLTGADPNNCYNLYLQGSSSRLPESVIPRT